MERYLIFMDRKIQYWQHVTSTQLDFNAIPMRIPASYFFGYQQSDYKFCEKRQKYLHNTEKEKPSWRADTI